MDKEKLTDMLISDTEEREEKIHEILKGRRSLNINIEHYRQFTFKDRAADKMASFTGSWAFIGYFCIIVVIWAAINTTMVLKKPFDPFPYVFMNFVLAFISSLQAPIIMMSQNREAQKDRIKAENDYLINMKSEIILEDLHFKIDDVLKEQSALKKDLKALMIKVEELEKREMERVEDGKGQTDGKAPTGEPPGREKPGLHH